MLFNVLVSLLPLMGIIGYFAEIQWLYLVSTIISLVCNVILALSGTLYPRSISLLIVACIIAGISTSSFWDGLLLGNAFFILVNNVITLIVFIFALIAQKR